MGDVAAKFKEYFTNLTWSSSAMLAISRRSEADYKALATDLGMPEIPTRVMLLGNKLPEPGDDVSNEVQEICGERFILFVSTIERRKNHEVIYKALHILGERGQLDPALKVVFVGMPGWGVGDLLKDIELDPFTKDHIVQLGHANDAELEPFMRIANSLFTRLFMRAGDCPWRRLWPSENSYLHLIGDQYPKWAETSSSISILGTPRLGLRQSADISMIRRSSKAGQSVFERNTTQFTGMKLPRR